jgi:Response regulator of the LytR/AlgR family
MPQLRTLIIDDEHLARKLLSDYVQKIPDLTLVGTCSNAFEALDFLKKESVDLIFSDIQMPDLTGLELMKMLKHRPAVIFTTAYSEFALESYELEAVDYLLKPIAFPRFFQAANKAIERFKMKSTEKADITPIAPLFESSHLSEKDFLMVRADHKMYRINFSELIFIEGQSEYVTFHLTSRKITAYYSLKKLEEELPANLFCRVHKSYIISLKSIEVIEGNLITIANRKITIGKIYKDNLMQQLYPESELVKEE